MKVLIMEDDPKISSFIKIGLETHNCTVDLAYDSDTAEKLAVKRTYDVIILDVIVPGMNGFELCKKFRTQHIHTPVLMLTSLDSIEDKLMGFENGADDYLLKPFHFQELIARVHALARRQQETYSDPLLTISDLELDTSSKKVRRNSREIKLTATEFKILELLMKHKDKVLDRMEIADKIWGYTFNSGTNVIDVHINALRKKLNGPSGTNLIHTVVGMGYVIQEND